MLFPQSGVRFDFMRMRDADADFMRMRDAECGYRTPDTSTSTSVGSCSNVQTLIRDIISTAHSNSIETQDKLECVNVNFFQF